MAEQWPSDAHWQDILDALNAIPEGPLVHRGTMMIQAQKMGLRRPFPPGRYGREMFLRAASAVLLLALVAVPVMAAPPAGADTASPMSRWYRGLKMPGSGASCCDESDCRPTVARRAGDRWEARTPDGTWLSVPDTRVLHEQVHPTGAAVLCSGHGLVFCFIPPQAGG